MRIFVIPSWYPSSERPVYGSFVKDQVEALAKYQNIEIAVSTWGHADSYIPTRKPWVFLKRLAWSFSQKQEIRKTIYENLIECFTPQIQFSHRLFFGGANNALIKANLQNLELAEKKLGGIDLIHAHVSYPAGYIAQKIYQQTGIPYIITEHMSPFPFASFLKNDKQFKEMIVKPLLGSKKIIAVSRPQKQRISEFGIPNICVIPNLVDTNRFKIKKGISKKVRFLTVGGLNKQKGIDILIHSLSRLEENELAKINLTIVGNGECELEYKSLSKKLELSEIITFHNSVRREDLPCFFQAADVFILPSRHESFGVVYIEALSAGLPVIATYNGGAETIINNKNGVLVQNGDIAKLTESISWMIANYTKFQPKKLREYAKRKYGSHEVSSLLYKTYQEVLA